ncbi:MAG: hypothetical protein IEMM0002_0656 [bacterium]|nr:MAG: hypothetical protein IEMM0002_0656 [bacterium]
MLKIKLLPVLVMTALLFISVSDAAAQKSQVRERELRIAEKCVSCHAKVSPGIINDWKESQHARSRVTCYDCHKAEKTDIDVQDHEGALIAVIPSPRDCSRCHPREVREFQDSHHAKAATFLSKKTPEGRQLDNVLGYKVEGKYAAIVGCEKCHGSYVKLGKNGTLTADSWPNSGIGRVNPDGSRGSCTA